MVINEKTITSDQLQRLVTLAQCIFVEQHIHRDFPQEYDWPTTWPPVQLHELLSLKAPVNPNVVDVVKIAVVLKPDDIQVGGVATNGAFTPWLWFKHTLDHKAVVSNACWPFLLTDAVVDDIEAFVKATNAAYDAPVASPATVA